MGDQNNARTMTDAHQSTPESLGLRLNSEFLENFCRKQFTPLVSEHQWGLNHHGGDGATDVSVQWSKPQGSSFHLLNCFSLWIKEKYVNG